MINMGWFEGLLDTVADRGRELIGMSDESDKSDFSDIKLCDRLIQGKGEATNVAVAREILRRWKAKDDLQKLNFLIILSNEFDCDKEAIANAVATYKADDAASFDRLKNLVEAPRQELFRRLNMAPNGTRCLVAIRAFLLQKLPQHPELNKVDADLQHLLGSWFNRGFLRLERIDWETSASVLEKLIEYEAVHPMQGWEDLRRRLNDKDRRCFAFFHPALPNVPLIFVEVALTCEISDSIFDLIDPQAPIVEQEPDTAIFYSINNALVGLRGVSFGNFLIKQVAEELKCEFEQIRIFSTLSPIPLMLSTIELILDPAQKKYTPQYVAKTKLQIKQILGFSKDEIAQQDVEFSKITTILETNDETLQTLCLYYLTVLKRGDNALDPVAHFHLSNGAYLHAINLRANLSTRAKGESWGCMVNYLYEDALVVSNHEAYVCDGDIAMSKEVQRQYKNLLSIID